MSCDNGWNPLRWDCETQGCFNVHKRPKIELFADCLPGRIAFSDVDGITEIKGNLLVLEWKNHRRIPRGQLLLYTRWTAGGPAAVLLIVGDARNMTVEEVACVYGGVIGPWCEMDIAGLRHEIQAWSNWAVAHPARPSGNRNM